MKNVQLSLVVCLLLAGCADPPKPAVTEHMGPGVIRTVEYWGEGEHSQVGHSRLVIETPDGHLRQFDKLCDKRVPGWAGLEFKDMVFQHNDFWDCYHIIDFARKP